MKLIKILGLKAPAKLKSQSNNKSLSQIRFLSFITFHFISNKIQLFASNFFSFVKTFFLRDTQGLLKGTTILLRGTTILLEGTTILLEGTTILLEGTTLLLGGTNIRLWINGLKIVGLTVNFKVFNIKEHIKIS